MAKSPQTVHDRIINASLGLAAEKPWRQVTLREIADAAGIPLDKLYENFSSKTEVVTAVMARTNATVLSGTDDAADSEPTHDRLLDALLRRLEALQPHKQAICSILRDMPADPAGLLCLAPGYFNAMAWMLEVAGIGSAGPFGRLRVKGLGVIYLGALRVWARDDSPDQGKTLAFLDRRLRQAGKMSKWLPDDTVFARRSEPAAEEEPKKSK